MPIRQIPETSAKVADVVVLAPSPTLPRDASAAELAELTGSYTAFDQVVDQYVAELRLGKRHRRVRPDHEGHFQPGTLPR